MRGVILGLLAVVGLGFGTTGADACHKCKKAPCVYAPPVPAYRCVTEMVPYTVMRTRMRVDFQPVTRTVMAMVPETTFVERTCTVMRAVPETHMVSRTYTVCRPVYDTQMVSQCYTVCRPVQTVRQVTSYCMVPQTSIVAVPVASKCGGGCGLGLLCGKLNGGKCGGLAASGCKYVEQTCYTSVPVAREVVETSYVSEVQTRQVPVTSCRMVTETKVATIPVTTCRMVPETRTVRVPVTTMHCVPKTVTTMVPVCVPEVVPVTCYRPVKRMVPVCQTGPMMMGQLPMVTAPMAMGQSVMMDSSPFLSPQAPVKAPPAVPASSQQ